MLFQMILELQEISDVTKAAWKQVPNSWGSKMELPFTGWITVKPRGILSIFIQKMIKKRAVVDKCAKEKTDTEEEYPRNDGKPKSLFELNTKFQREPVKLSENGCNMLIFFFLFVCFFFFLFF